MSYCQSKTCFTTCIASRIPSLLSFVFSCEVKYFTRFTLPAVREGRVRRERGVGGKERRRKGGEEGRGGGLWGGGFDLYFICSDPYVKVTLKRNKTIAVEQTKKKKKVCAYKLVITVFKLTGHFPIMRMAHQSSVPKISS